MGTPSGAFGARRRDDAATGGTDGSRRSVRETGEAAATGSACCLCLAAGRCSEEGRSWLGPVDRWYRVGRQRECAHSQGCPVQRQTVVHVSERSTELGDRVQSAATTGQRRGCDSTSRQSYHSRIRGRSMTCEAGGLAGVELALSYRR
jgi:hypothetical protein